MDSKSLSKETIDHIESAHVVIERFIPKCNVCDDVFVNFEDYKDHIMVHAKKIYKNEVLIPLELNYNNLGRNFVAHMTSAYVDIEFMEFKCKECYRVFQNINEYNLHLIKHVKRINGHNQNIRFEKVFKCDECNQMFVQKKTLEAHSVIHKPFPHICHCGVGFYLKSDLLRHKELVHIKQFREEMEKLTLRQQRALKNQYWSPEIARKKVKENMSNSPDTLKPRKPTLKAELVTKTKANNKPVKRMVHVKKEETVPSDMTYNCDSCNITCDNISLFKKHFMQTHTASKNHTCEVCNKTFSKRLNLSSHVTRVHLANKPYACSFCGKAFACKAYKQVHERIHTGEKPYVCNICNKRFNQSSTLKLHLERHRGIKDFSCSVCDKKFYSSHAMELHLRVHTGEKPYSCMFCDKSFSDPSAFKRHERTHTGVKPYACSVCDMKFSDASGRIAHERYTHARQRNFKCEFCKKKFSTRSNLKLHTTAVHSFQKNYECKKCSKRFSLKQYLSVHMKSHSERPWCICDYCGYKTRSKYNLVPHIQNLHLKESRKYKCDVCNLKFVHRCVLLKHKNLKHQRFEKFQCDICKQQFSLKTCLISHMLNNHSNIKCDTCKKPFCNRRELDKHYLKGCIKCEVCQKAFPSNHRKNQHYSVHKTAKTIECKTCYKRFKTESRLRFHCRNAHEEKVYECDYCSKRFTFKRYLIQHIFSNHLVCVYCNICGRSFFSDLELKQHKSKGCIDRVACEMCDKIIRRRSYRTHLKWTHGKKYVECHYCGKKINSKSSLIRHFKLMHKFVYNVSKQPKSKDNLDD